MIRARYTPPELDGHNIIYKGKRFWIFEINEKYPFHGLEKDYDTVVFDKAFGNWPLACARKTPKGYEGSLAFTQDRVEISGDSPEELLRSTIQACRVYEKHFSGRVSPDSPFKRVYKLQK
jgi:hypothetical protein